MPNYLTPGIYLEEVATGPRPIQAVGTSTAGFVGKAPKADAHPGRAVAINNWSQFQRELAPQAKASTPLASAVYGFFENGGSRCYVVNLGESDMLEGDGPRRGGLALLEEIDEVAVVAAPGFADAAAYDALLSHCEKMKDRVAILDPPAELTSVEQLTRVAAPAAKKGAAAKEPGLRPRNSDGGYGAFYFPRITVRDPLAPSELIEVAPSGHVAGLYARSDAARGVHKAPANEILRGALDVGYPLTREEQGILNEKGVNCIRFFPQTGIRVWGARTLAGGGSEWRYLNVRRLFNMIEESIVESTAWTIFEPNDLSLWKAIRRDVNAFLTRLWRQGALKGATPDEAFFVKCDEETNPQDVIDAGQVVTVIGIAPVKPAEFIIFRIGQHAGGAETESEGGR